MAYKIFISSIKNDLLASQIGVFPSQISFLYRLSRDKRAFCDKKPKVSVKSFLCCLQESFMMFSLKKEKEVKEREKDNFWFQNLLILSL